MLVVAIALIIVEINVNGTGFKGKTLWDWLQLLVIPIVIAVGGYVINLTISRSEQEATKQRAQSEREEADKRAETEREIALDNQQEAALQTYIDKIAELLLEKKLRESKSEEDEVRNIARIRTLTTLARLDNKRKKDVLQFLNESGLIEQGTTFIHLVGANLREANLNEANLSGAYLVDLDLSGANLIRAHLGYIPFPPEDEKADIKGADLSRANLSQANLRGAKLEHVKLKRANLTKANLSRADLEGANLSLANLKEADLSFAIFLDADLSFANLTGANLKNTMLNYYDSDYGYYKERGANLMRAKLEGVIGISIEELEKQARSLKGATMPDGSIHP